MTLHTYAVGDSVVLDEQFSVEDANGNLIPTDPTTVLLAVRAPDGTTQTYDYAQNALTRLGTGSYTKTIIAGQTGLWAYEYTGTGDAAGVAQGQFYVSDALSRTANISSSAALTSLSAVKLWLGIADTDATQDDRLTWLTNTASVTVCAYAQREFAPITTGLTRTFPLRANGLVRFGGWDLQTVTGAGVQIDTDAASTPTTIPNTQYQLQPVSAPNGVYTMLQFYTFAIGPILRQAYGLSRQVAITGTWGWPSIPADVEQACIITVAKWFKRDQVAWSNELPVPQLGPGDGLALPYDARVLLAPYRRPI